MTVWHVVAIIAIILNVVWGIGYLSRDEHGGVLISVSAIILCAIYLIMVPFTGEERDINQREKSHKLAVEMIANGCKVYLDGQEVDPDVIILEDYKVTVREDFVILSRQQKDRYSE